MCNKINYQKINDYTGILRFIIIHINKKQEQYNYFSQESALQSHITNLHATDYQRTYVGW